MKVSTIVIQFPSDEADRLLDCLRVKARPFGIGFSRVLDFAVEADGGTDIQVTDQSDSVPDLSAFLIDQLDECGREAELDWREHLRVVRPASLP